MIINIPYEFYKMQGVIHSNTDLNKQLAELNQAYKQTILLLNNHREELFKDFNIKQILGDLLNSNTGLDHYGYRQLDNLIHTSWYKVIYLGIYNVRDLLRFIEDIIEVENKIIFSHPLEIISTSKAIPISHITKIAVINFEKSLIVFLTNLKNFIVYLKNCLLNTLRLYIDAYSMNVLRILPCDINKHPWVKIVIDKARIILKKSPSVYTFNENLEDILTYTFAPDKSKHQLILKVKADFDQLVSKFGSNKIVIVQYCFSALDATSEFSMGSCYGIAKNWLMVRQIKPPRHRTLYQKLYNIPRTFEIIFHQHNQESANQSLIDSNFIGFKLNDKYESIAQAITRIITYYQSYRLYTNSPLNIIFTMYYSYLKNSKYKTTGHAIGIRINSAYNIEMIDSGYAHIKLFQIYLLSLFLQELEKISSDYIYLEPTKSYMIEIIQAKPLAAMCLATKHNLKQPAALLPYFKSIESYNKDKQYRKQLAHLYAYDNNYRIDENLEPALYLYKQINNPASTEQAIYLYFLIRKIIFLADKDASRAVKHLNEIGSLFTHKNTTAMQGEELICFTFFSFYLALFAIKKQHKNIANLILKKLFQMKQEIFSDLEEFSKFIAEYSLRISVLLLDKILEHDTSRQEAFVQFVDNHSEYADFFELYKTRNIEEIKFNNLNISTIQYIIEKYDWLCRTIKMCFKLENSNNNLNNLAENILDIFIQKQVDYEKFLPFTKLLELKNVIKNYPNSILTHQLKNQ